MVHKLRSGTRLFAVSAALTLSLVACGNADEAEQTTTTMMTPTTAAAALMPVGSACSSLPATGEGSVTGMSDDPVATAASNNPRLSTLAGAVRQSGLAETLNGAGPFTVFAPVNSAFQAVPQAQLNAVLNDQQQLQRVLTYHVVPGRAAAADLQDGQSLTTVQGGTLTVDITGDVVTINNARVVCANIPVANGVVHLVDGVLLPPNS